MLARLDSGADQDVANRGISATSYGPSLNPCLESGRSPSGKAPTNSRTLFPTLGGLLLNDPLND
jgi:hypothetical protein